MTQEEKQLLLVDLCARLPYGVFVVNTVGGRNIRGYLSQVDTMYKCVLVDTDLVSHNGEKREFSPIEHIKPYLRPMSSMSEEEDKEFWEIVDNYGSDTNAFDGFELGDDIDWLNIHHFDYRGLIEKGLALPATKGMYQAN